ncbi:tRNA (N(6)-L-threonylcarbamoyladenosine(37)-C(2))-methylthiotransferase MtaB [Tanticharoenia sakaeratensis]|uniref:Methylthiotransferase n=1 Tax=Tanticharoenia sakaeratensis NBRC 103193 TaxID=1231623 RepID=A0A0D6MHF9_9PROT|nr:tRNA (N(6)-L-threonylcarbamoyladenosine(37)-C(2))-methylthiotransferase MtaB [Tanticharoenia sakaeratensis]GAN52708.1 methylthiotransferase [Tanticharoenia sakaeratensis NBRC 103193]GBQ24328.1 tRNA 2-methylthioadenosine synthase MiaB [Tanticharoenia sakaeratensis NBRC 103193]
MSARDGAAAELLTFGCRLNLYESEVMRGHAAALRDTVIVNTCAVTAAAERDARQAIAKLRRTRPDARIVVTGCAAQRDPGAWAALPGVARVLGNAEKLRPESWAADATETAVSDIMTARTADPQPISAFAGHARAFLQVQQGCDHRCTFCVIPYGRGPSRSVPAAVAVAQARALVASGHREIVLTGVDIASWGSDLPGRPPLGDLCRRILTLVPELGRLRLSSIDPAAIDETLWKLLADEPRLAPYLHLSLQAGCDLILKRMKRRHDVAQVRAVVARARAARPDIGLGADVIAGFPTETEAQAQATCDLLDELGVAFLHVFPYSERPGTPAARMPGVPMPERRVRAAALRSLGATLRYRYLAGLVGREADVLLESEAFGHSEQFAPVRLIDPVPEGRGSIRRVRLKSVADAPGRKKVDGAVLLAEIA